MEMAEERLIRHSAMVQAYQSGKTLQEVANSFGISRERVRQILKLNRVTDRHHGVNSMLTFLAKAPAMAEEVIRSYQSGMSIAKLYNQYPNISRYKIRRILTDAKVTRTSKQASQYHPKRVPDEVRRAIATGYALNKSKRDLAQAFGLSLSGVVKILDEQRKALE